MAEALGRISERLPAIIVQTLREQCARVARLDEEVGEIERRIKLWHRGNADSRRIAEIPGVGVLTATAVVAAMGDPAAFKSGREFAAWLGLVPRHIDTGGRVRLLGISKRGDRYLRTLQRTRLLSRNSGLGRATLALPTRPWRGGERLLAVGGCDDAESQRQWRYVPRCSSFSVAGRLGHFRKGSILRPLAGLG